MKYTIETVYNDRVTYAPSDKRRMLVSIPRHLSNIAVHGYIVPLADIAEFETVDIEVLENKQITVNRANSFDILYQNVDAPMIYNHILYA